MVTSAMTWSPWSHTPEDHLAHGLRQQPLLSLALLLKHTHLPFKCGGMRFSPQICAPAQGCLCPLSPRGGTLP